MLKQGDMANRLVGIKPRCPLEDKVLPERTKEQRDYEA